MMFFRVTFVTASTGFKSILFFYVGYQATVFAVRSLTDL
ncbi:hypothetical protein J2Y91_003973 [Erwinia aphidicola]|nr:hypothetical protein [Erwinia aphidicola]